MNLTAADHHSTDERLDQERAGRTLFAAVVLAFVGIAIPVVWRGAPVADDFNNCVAAGELGVGGFIRASWNQLGAIRPARILEILLTASVCRRLPFGVAIVVPLTLTIVVAVATRGFLRELKLPALWANVGGALWLLQPLGTESGLWPAALHVPFGLALTVQALRWYRRGMYVRGGLANLGAALSVEQVILALPLAAALITRGNGRRRAVATSLMVVAIVAASVMLWPGGNPRLRVGLSERIAGLAANPIFYVAYPAVGLGLHSIPLALQWAWPWGMALLAAAGTAGWRIGPRLANSSGATDVNGRTLVLAVAALLVLTNLVVVFSVPQQGSPRVFAPTWLVLAMTAAVAGASVRWRRPQVLAAGGAVFAAAALLSLMFSVSVRLESANFTARAAALIAARVPDDGRVAICNVRRTVVQPAPRGAYSVHEFIYEWAAERALQYYAGRRATVFLAGDLWDRPCPPRSDVDAVISFDELLTAAER